MIVDCDRATLQAALADEHEHQALLARGIYGLLAFPPRLEGSDPDRARRVDFQGKLQLVVAAYHRERHVGRRDRVIRATKIGISRVEDAALVGVIAGQLAKDRDEGGSTSIATAVGRWRHKVGKPLMTAGALKNAHGRLWRRHLPVAHLALAVAVEWAAAPEGWQDMWLLLHPNWCARALVDAETLFRPAIEEALDVDLMRLLPEHEETFPF